MCRLWKNSLYENVCQRDDESLSRAKLRPWTSSFWRKIIVYIIAIFSGSIFCRKVGCVRCFKTMACFI